MGTTEEMTKTDAPVRLSIALHGLVQGTGFRPFVFRLARELHLKGWVLNNSRGVFIEAEGCSRNLDSFLGRLQKEKPSQSSILHLESAFLEPKGYERFEIRESDEAGEKTALIMPDIATCGPCLKEIFDPADRRYRYPFTNCTDCGPRYSIMEALPYDRRHTSMKHFRMCKKCEEEYHDPSSRRFHAQPNACPDCGPRLELWTTGGGKSAAGGEALKRAAAAVRRGEILALKGLGGFQLIVDAFNEKAILRLRQRKHRDEKPFALMAGGAAMVRRHCEVSEFEERLLSSAQAPIVLLRRLADAGLIPDAAAPKNPFLGFMLPCTPLHHLLLAELKQPVIATSGNLSEEPMAVDEHAALKSLGAIGDVFLVHDRPIIRPVDDSIVRIMAGREAVLRRARGYAPLPVAVREAPEVSVLAVGAHLKNTVAQSVNGQIFLSQHIGDLSTDGAFESFRQTVHTFRHFYESAPRLAVTDRHPGYLSSQYAKHAGIPVLGIQHHYAHVLSCMAENDLEGPVLGVALDGSGLGTDGTLWGGEFLWVDKNDYVRAAHLRTFRLPGGEKAIREPRRSALGILYEIFGRELFDMKLKFFKAFDKQELRLFREMLEKGILAPVTSSAGRLFDAVAALLGLGAECRFEGQAAMALEHAADGRFEETAYPVWFSEYSSHVDPSRMRFACHNSVHVLDWEPLIRRILGDLEDGVPAGTIAARFHNTLTEGILNVASSVRETGVVLTGGCFQNKYLLERTVSRLREKGFKPYWHQRVPPNDGGIALGQVAAASRLLRLGAAVPAKGKDHVSGRARQD